MPELATAWVTLAVNTKGMQGDIRQAFGATDAKGHGQRAGKQFSQQAVRHTNLTGIERKLAQAGQRGMATLGNVLKKGAIGAGAAVAGAIGTSVALGFGRLSAIDDAQAKLRGLGHDANSVAKVMDNALAAVKGTAFGLGDAAGLAGVMAASGIQPGKELETTLKRVADAAAISGSSLGEMGDIWAKAAAKGRIDGQIVSQLLMRQIPIYDILAEKMGVNAAEVAKMVSKGKVSFQDFSDAMNDNLAGSALKTGETVRGAFDNLKAAMGRLGAAALEPGFNQLPSVLTAATKAVDDLTPAVKDFFQEMSDQATYEWIPRLQQGWDTLRNNEDLRDGLQATWDVLRNLVSTASKLGPPLVQIGRSLGSVTEQLGISTWKLLVVALQTTAQALDAISGPLQFVANLMESHQGAVTAAVVAYSAFRGIPALLRPVSTAIQPVVGGVQSLGRAIQQSGPRAWANTWSQSMQWMRQANPQLSSTGAAVRVLGVNARAAATGGMNALRNATRGVIGALGGPFTVGLMAAGAALTLISNQNQKAAQGMQAYERGVKRVQSAQVELNSALMQARGAVDESVTQTMVDRIAAVGEELDGASQKAGSFLDTFRDANTGSIWDGLGGAFSDYVMGREERDNLAVKIRQDADAARDAKAVFEDLNLTQKDLADTVYGSQGAFDQLTGRLRSTGDAGSKVADDLTAARQAFQRSQQAAQFAVPGVSEMAEAMRVLGSNTATAADKTRALSNALSALNPERTRADAVAAHDQVLLDIEAATAQAVDQTQGFGQALLDSAGQIDTASQNGQTLRRTLIGMVDATTNAVASGEDLEKVLAKNQPQLEALARQYGLTTEQVQGLIDTMGGRDLKLTATLAGADETVAALGLVARAFDQVPESKEVTLKTQELAGAEDKLRELGIQVEQIDSMPGHVRVVAETDEARDRLQGILTLLSGGEGAIPEDVPIKVTDQGGEAVFDLLKSIGEQVTTDNDKNIKVEAPLGEKVKQLLAELGYEVRTNNDKTIEVTLVGVEAARATIADLTRGASVPARVPGRAFGAIVPMADGGLRYIRKPTSADIYAGRGAGTIFAEQETGGEAYIPLARSKRGRSTAILAEVARMFGYGVVPMADGGITVDELKRFASQIHGQPYQWGGGAGDTFATDCSGAQSTIANFVTGGSGRFATANQSQALLSRGFQQGDPPAGIAAYWVGWENGGPGGGHTAGTILDPDGGNVNVEMGGRSGGGQFGGTAAGASDFPNRAWVALSSGDDPSNSNFSGGGQMTRTQRRQLRDARQRVDDRAQSVTSAQMAVDELSTKKNVTPKQRADREAALARAQREHQDALEDLADKEAEIAEKLGKTSDKLGKGGSGSGDGQDLGQAIVGGIMQSIGLDGSVFSNPLEWPNFKSAMALLNWGGGMMKSMFSGGQDQDGQSTLLDSIGAAVGISSPGSSIPTEPIGAVSPYTTQHGQGQGQAPGPGGAAPLVQYNGPVNMGVDPNAMMQKQNANMNMAFRSNMVRQG